MTDSIFSVEIISRSKVTPYHGLFISEFSIEISLKIEKAADTCYSVLKQYIYDQNIFMH